MFKLIKLHADYRRHSLINYKNKHVESRNGFLFFQSRVASFHLGRESSGLNFIIEGRCRLLLKSSNEFKRIPTHLSERAQKLIRIHIPFSPCTGKLYCGLYLFDPCRREIFDVSGSQMSHLDNHSLYRSWCKTD